MSKKGKTAHQVALTDIRNDPEREHRKKNSTYILAGRAYYEIWNVTINGLFLKEATQLNRDLGIHKLNR